MIAVACRHHPAACNYGAALRVVTASYCGRLCTITLGLNRPRKRGLQGVSDGYLSATHVRHPHGCRDTPTGHPVAGDTYFIGEIIDICRSIQGDLYYSLE